MKKLSVIVVTSVVLSAGMTSCVSKKKYDDLMRAKIHSDRNVVDLQNQNGQLQKDLATTQENFNIVRYQLTQNNAQKDTKIDALYTQLRTLEQKQNQLKSELTDASNKIKYKEVSADQQIASLESAVKQLTSERSNLQKDLQDIQTKLEWENQSIKSELASATTSLTNKDAELKKLETKSKDISRQIESLKSERTKNQAEIKKLNNLVNLLKKELNQ
ncbi:MAG: hypothetical protein ACRDDZ_13800 [Marinifilaceae bacterium]